jgi:hypothetical protein
LDTLDRGFLVLPNGKTVKAAYLPISIHASDGTKAEWVTEAANWWNKALSKDGTPRVVFMVEAGYRSVPVYSDHYILPESRVVDGYNDWWDPATLEGAHPLGRCTSKIDDRTGHIIESMIELSYHLAWHDRTMVQILKNEMGHLLGLKDDVFSRDLNSVMSEKLLWNGQLTQGDFDRLLEAYVDM